MASNMSVPLFYLVHIKKKKKPKKRIFEIMVDHSCVHCRHSMEVHHECVIILIDSKIQSPHSTTPPISRRAIHLPHCCLHRRLSDRRNPRRVRRREHRRRRNLAPPSWSSSSEALVTLRVLRPRRRP